MTTAQFHFNAANGATINDPDITVQAPALFTPWFSQTASQAYGSNFGYTQTFNLSTDASSVGSVTITLTNSVGNSITVTAQMTTLRSQIPPVLRSALALGPSSRCSPLAPSSGPSKGRPRGEQQQRPCSPLLSPH